MLCKYDMNPNDGFADTIREDLRQCSPMLLEAGLTNVEGQATGAGPLGVLISHVNNFASLVPRLPS